MNEFDIFDENGVIINGHMPVKIKKGESPIKAGGKLIIIDGGMLMYGKEASNRKQEIDRQHYTIPNQRPKDKHCGKI